MVVEGANRTDMKLTGYTLASVPPNIEARRLLHLLTSGREQGLCLDAGYDYDEVRAVAQEFGYTTHIRSRGVEKVAKVAGKQARRWVVERSHSWLNRYRRLLVRWEKNPFNYLGLLHLACAILTWNQCLFG
jgi:transposase